MTTKTLTPDQVRAQRSFALVTVDSAEEQDRKAMRQATDKVSAALTQGRQPWYSDLQAAVTLPARLALWDTVHLTHRALVLDVLPDDGPDPETDWEQASWIGAAPDRLTTLGDVAEEVRDHLLRNLPYLHGSTDDTSRLLDSAARAGRAEWMRDVGAWGLRAR